jgi:DinB superfamily
MEAIHEPRLAPPGAGLPPFELSVGRLLFRLRRLTTSRQRLDARFVQERETIRTLIRPVDSEMGGRRVLISRPRGLEDSSRYWSLWMTLDHLRIVHREMAQVIDRLARGERVPGQASTAAVKPDPAATMGVVAEYEAACDALRDTITGIPDLRTAVRYTHPWFGSLDAAGWHALASGHLRIHRIQIQRILRALGGFTS